MRDELLDYYERELTFLRQMGAEFAEKYPKIASRLLLEPDRCEDPHVERMVEAFAFLAARVHRKIDDEFPEITEALLGILFPHYIRPVPSMSIVEFHVDPEQGKLTTGIKVRRGTLLYSRSVDGVPCRFRTCYDTTLWPLSVAEAQWTTPDRLNPPVRAANAAAALRFELKCLPDVSFEKLEMSSLRFYLNGESNLVHTVYELLLNNCAQILVRDPGQPRTRPLELPYDSIRAAGFSESEAMLPYSRRSFAGYRLLQEYFSFPEKFFFVELGNLDRLGAAGFTDRAEIIVLISPFERADREQMLELGVSAKTLRPDCSPIINLFEHTAEPIMVDQLRHEYPVEPDVRRRHALEVFSIEEVVSANPQSQEVTRFEPFFSYRHSQVRDPKQMFWHATRRASTRRGDEGTDIFLTTVDRTGRPASANVETLTVRCLCTNRDLPARLPFGSETGDFEIEGLPSVRRIVALKKPAATLRPPVGGAALWRLISQLSLNYLSLVSEGKEAFQEVLGLYNFSDSAHLGKQIQGINSLTSRKHFARVVSENGISFVRGTQVEMLFDEEQFVGGGVFLFASVIEHFLGLYVSMNSFSQLVARTAQRKEVLREWPPRAGEAVLL
ncbi:MAG TPA: type VI secretion system baseplate subunit TssF [Bryobacteraceae bacterium]|nr:type VI secretion system baseplate subunit TssF [Bryobacteraceae bacterium]